MAHQGSSRSLGKPPCRFPTFLLPSGSAPHTDRRRIRHAGRRPITHNNAALIPTGQTCKWRWAQASGRRPVCRDQHRSGQSSSRYEYIKGIPTCGLGSRHPMRPRGIVLAPLLLLLPSSAMVFRPPCSTGGLLRAATPPSPVMMAKRSSRREARRAAKAGEEPGAAAAPEAAAAPAPAAEGPIMGAQEQNLVSSFVQAPPARASRPAPRLLLPS